MVSAMQDEIRDFGFPMTAQARWSLRCRTRSGFLTTAAARLSPPPLTVRVPPPAVQLSLPLNAAISIWQELDATNAFRSARGRPTLDCSPGVRFLLNYGKGRDGYSLGLRDLLLEVDWSSGHAKVTVESPATCLTARPATRPATRPAARRATRPAPRAPYLTARHATPSHS
eukprot:2023776-Prymnesium_polylepis.1